MWWPFRKRIEKPIQSECPSAVAEQADSVVTRDNISDGVSQPTCKLADSTNNNGSYSIWGDGVSTSSPQIAISQYSEFPRYYNIDGIVYDIDNISDIKKIPLIRNLIFINGKPYGMDTILFEHYRRSSDRMLGYAAYDKCQEFRDSGIINKSDWEIDMDEREQRRRENEEIRKAQCDSFTIDDMQQFPDIPFLFSYVTELFHTNGVAWFQLNMNNQAVVLQYISAINDIIVDAHEYISETQNAHIDLEHIDFNYPAPMYEGCMCNTRVECYPYTPTGKISKYPAVIQFATDFNEQGVRTAGEIKILRDGNIGAATVRINSLTFKIGLHGLSLVLKRVDYMMMSGNVCLFKFSDNYE